MKKKIRSLRFAPCSLPFARPPKHSSREKSLGLLLHDQSSLVVPSVRLLLKPSATQRTARWNLEARLVAQRAKRRQQSRQYWSQSERYPHLHE